MPAAASRAVCRWGRHAAESDRAHGGGGRSRRLGGEEEEGAVDEWEEEAAVDVVVSDSEEELEVLRQPNLIQKLADVVTQRASCVTEL